MKRKMRIMAILVMLVAQTLLSGIYPFKAMAEETETTAATAQAASEIKENILTGVVLKDEKGNVIHAGENPDLHPSALTCRKSLRYTMILIPNHCCLMEVQSEFSP